MIEDVTAQGAQLEVPAEAEVKDRYDMPEFERNITMPDHVRKLSEHLNKLLAQYGRMDKTMIFCVNTEHAREVTRLLNDFNKDLNVSDYAVCIVSEEGATGKALLEKFQNTGMNLPALATTVDLLTTGVDAPSVRNVVFMKPVASVVSFKQIIGRGSRLCPDTEKFWFRIIDYTGATRLFDDWDKPSEPPEGGANTEPPFTCIVRGTVRDADTGQPIEHAHVFLQIGPYAYPVHAGARCGCQETQRRTPVSGVKGISRSARMKSSINSPARPDSFNSPGLEKARSSSLLPPLTITASKRLPPPTRHSQRRSI